MPIELIEEMPRTPGPPRQGPPPEVLNTVTGQIAVQLGKLLDEAGLSTSDFAQKCGVSPDAVRKWLQGKAAPNLDRWPHIAAVLGKKSANDLLPKIPAALEEIAGEE